MKIKITEIDASSFDVWVDEKFCHNAASKALAAEWVAGYKFAKDDKPSTEKSSKEEAVSEDILRLQELAGVVTEGARIESRHFEAKKKMRQYKGADKADISKKFNELDDKFNTAYDSGSMGVMNDAMEAMEVIVKDF